MNLGKHNVLSATLLVLTIMMAAPGASAQKNGDREAWAREMSQYKAQHLTRELKLTKEQQERFLPFYRQMEKELGELNHQTHSMTREVRKKGAKATDLERTKAAEALFELKTKEGAIEMKYLPRFKEMLTPTQLLELKHAERHFNREMMNRRQQLKQK